jgi:malonyl-CoA O-methyltransferase
MSDYLDQLGRKFARFATNVVVARPALWPLLRGPLRVQFDRLASSWEGRRAADALASLAAALERVDTVERALDVGTGTGKAARFLAERYPTAEIVGVDLSPAMISAAAKLVPPELSPRVRFEVADASRLSYPDAFFDLVVLLNMIPFFEEIARVTAPGGVLVASFSSGSTTPIWVPPDTLREHLAPLGFGGFEELAAGEGTAFLARRHTA